MSDNENVGLVQDIEHEEIEQEARALVPAGDINVDDAIAKWERYLTLTKRLLTSDDYHVVGNKPYKKKSAWRKYMRAFALTEDEARSHVDVERDERGFPVYASAWAVVEGPDGRVGTGYHECNRYERCDSGCGENCDGKKHWSHPGDIPATAHTRAKNRAISDWVGAGEVSAEEMRHDAKEALACPKCGEKAVTEYTDADMINKVGGRFYCKKGDGGCGAKFKTEDELKTGDVKTPLHESEIWFKSENKHEEFLQILGDAGFESVDQVIEQKAMDKVLTTVRDRAKEIVKARK